MKQMSVVNDMSNTNITTDPVVAVNPPLVASTKKLVQRAFAAKQSHETTKQPAVLDPIMSRARMKAVPAVVAELKQKAGTSALVVNVINLLNNPEVSLNSIILIVLKARDFKLAQILISAQQKTIRAILKSWSESLIEQEKQAKKAKCQADIAAAAAKVIRLQRCISEHHQKTSVWSQKVQLLRMHDANIEVLENAPCQAYCLNPQRANPALQPAMRKPS